MQHDDAVSIRLRLMVGLVVDYVLSSVFYIKRSSSQIKFSKIHKKVKNCLESFWIMIKRFRNNNINYFYFNQ
jgi:uncharacterized membrane protein YciS (DUF1049 family)